jgi:protein TonB
MSRTLVIAAIVVVFHIASLWAMQSGLLRRAVMRVVPAEIVVEFLVPLVPKVSPQPPATPKPTPVKQAAPRDPAPIKTVAALPQALANLTPSPNAPTGAIASDAPAPQMAAPVTQAPPTLATALHRVQLPSSDANYLQNPKPSYPPMSKRLGEQGKVVVRVLIEVDGTAHKADIKQSSGFDRLDQAALNTVLRWRYVPGKRSGLAEAMWFNVPISFVLE